MPLYRIKYALVVSLLTMTLVAPLSAGAATSGAAQSQCRCSASLSYARPILQFRNGSLVFIPSVNIRIRSRGAERTPWTAHIDLAGETSYSSKNATVPAGTSFSQSKDIYKGACGDNISFSGWQLSPVVLSGLNQGLTGKQKIDGTVRMQATLSACATDSELKEFHFTLKELGNLLVRGWSSVRN